MRVGEEERGRVTIDEEKKLKKEKGLGEGGERERKW